MENPVARAISVGLLLLAMRCLGAPASQTYSAEGIRSLLLGGKWARHADEKLFFPDGTFEARDGGRNYITRGTWRLSGRSLRLTEDNETLEHRIILISDTELRLTFSGAGQRLHYTRSARHAEHPDGNSRVRQP